MSSFKDGYENFTKSSAGRGAFQGSAYVGRVESAIDELQKSINAFSGYKTGVDQLKGDVAEFWHSGTHNIDATVKDVKARTYVDRSHFFASPDITSNFGKKYGLKYYQDGEESAKQQAKSYFERYMKHKADTKNDQSFADFLKERGFSEEEVLAHDPIYAGQVRIIPKDQLLEAVDFLKRKIAKESDLRPEQIKRYEDTLRLLRDKIESNQGSKSIPLSKKEAEELTTLAKEGEFDPAEAGLTTGELIKFKYIMQQSLEAGLSAAAISAALRVAPEIYKTLEGLIKNGEIDPDALKRISIATAQGGAEGFFRGSMSAGLTAACLSGQLGASLKSVDPTIIGAVTVIAMNTIRNSYKLARHEMTKEEFADACMRDLFVTTCSLVLGGVGGTLGSLIKFPVLGYLIGSFIGSVAASFVYDTAYRCFLSFCCDSGFTFFGLVDQNYELPDEVLKEIGIEVLEYERFELDEFKYDTFEYDRFEFDEFEFDRIGITFLRRGVIGVNKIGYV